MSSGRAWLAEIGSARAPTLRWPGQHRRPGAVCAQFFIEPSEERIGVPIDAPANGRGSNDGAVGDPVINDSLRDRKQLGNATFGDRLVGDGHEYQAGQKRSIGTV